MLLGIEPPLTMVGQDLRPAIFGGDDKHAAEPVFSSVMSHHMVIRWPWKLIVEPSLKLYELYNLKSDPLERVNMYDGKPALARELVQEIQVWLDGLAKAENEAETALNMGHMRDTRAVPGLKRLALNSGAPVRDRVEAVQLLGKMGDYSVIPVLKSIINDKNEDVAIAAALSLGVLGDSSGQDLMREALFDPNPTVRDSAALVLGRLGDDAAAPALVEALGRDDVETREQAIRALGRLGDPDTIEPLLDALTEERTRYLVVLALGMIGDQRAYGALMDVLENDRLADVRGYAVVALGWLERSEAIPRLARLLKEEPEIKWTAESLVRLGGVGKAPLFGTDASNGLKTLKSGFDRCKSKPKKIHSEFLDRTTCRTVGPTAELEFFADAPNGAVVIVRARHLIKDKGMSVPLAIQVDGVEVGRVELLGEFHELRVTTPAGTWPPGEHKVSLQLAKKGSFELDHLLVLIIDK
jgi:HEAT repeat protein